MTSIEGYEIVHEMHTGPRSRIHRARRKKDGQPVIIKRHANEFPAEAERQRLRREFEIGAEFSTSHVIGYYDLVPCAHAPAVVEEDYGAESLAQYLRGREVDVAESLSIAIQLASGLAEIHAHGVVHKALAPDNVLISPISRLVKIADFGIATQIPREVQSAVAPGATAAVLAYVSPEQTGRMNRSLDYRTDFYSLGVTLYECLTGRRPYESDDAIELVHCHIARHPAAPHECRAAVPEALSDIVMKLMSKSPDERYQSAEGLLADLEQCQKHLSETGRVPPFFLGRYDVSGRLTIPEKLYGREKEVDTLLRAFDRASRGAVEMLLVSGYSGVGKSCLVHEVYKPVTQRKGYFASGKFEQLSRNVAYGAIAQSFREVIRHILAEDDRQVRRWRDSLLSALGPNGQVIVDVIPEAEHLIGEQSPLADLGPTETQNRFHLAFLSFVKVLAERDHPLVLFLDDLQWADSASLDLIKLIALDEDMEHLFVIGAYRDNEVDASHPAMMAIAEMREAGLPIHAIELAPLDVSHVNHLIADSLSCPPQQCLPLAELAHAKTGGNPFFVKAYLHSLHDDRLLTSTHEPAAGGRGVPPTRWRWDVEQIGRTPVTTNVADLFVRKITLLPDSTIEVLKTGSGLGHAFSSEALGAAMGKGPDETLPLLEPALRSGMLVQSDHRFSFIHDRVREAAYSLIDESDRQEMHLHIGRHLLAQSTEEELQARLHDVVTHLNVGRSLIADPAERVTLARLNLQSGRRARDSAAYQAAADHFAVGVELLPDDAWTQHYALAYELHLAQAEGEFLVGELDRSEALLKLLLSKVRSPAERSAIHVMQISHCSFVSRYAEAIDIGREALGLLGATFPHIDDDLMPKVESLFEETFAGLGDRRVDSLLALPELEDPLIRAQVDVLSALLPLTYYVHPGLLAYCAASLVNASIQYGNAPTSPSGYSFFAVLLVARGDYEGAHEFGVLALTLADQYENGPQIAMACHMFSTCINHWRQALETNLAYAQRGYEVGVESGDLQWSTYTRYPLSITHLQMGTHLQEFLEIVDTCHTISEKAKNEIMCQVLKPLRQFALNLSGKTAGRDTFETATFSEARFLERSQTTALMSIPWFHALKMKALYLHEQYPQALEYAAEAERSLEFCPGQLVVFDAHYYRALTQLAICTGLSAEDASQQLQALADTRDQVKTWAENSPGSFQSQHLLLEAEASRIRGESVAAMDQYERAIDAARGRGHTHHEALANELYAKFWLALGREPIAGMYLREACYLYERWGATAKVQGLEDRYGPIMSRFLAESERRGVKRLPGTRGVSRGTERTGDALDLMTVVKASQAISREITLEKLLAKMMEIIVENAGAQKGCLIRTTGDQAYVEAAVTADTGGTAVVQSTPIDQSRDLCRAVVHYVARSGDNVVLRDAAQEGPFTQTPYVQENKTKSVLCIPFEYQHRAYGVLYLENNLVPGAFTEDRVELLRVLLAQAAISMENAELFEMRTQAEGARARLVAILEMTSDLVSTSTPDRRITYMNKAGRRLIGRGDDEDLSAKQIPDVHPKWAMDIIATEGIPTAIRDGIWVGETALLGAEGRDIPVSQMILAHRSESGEMEYLSTIMRDISERKRAEAELRRAQDYIRNIIDSMPSVLVGVDAEGALTQWNREAEGTTGLAADEARGRALADVLPQLSGEMARVRQVIQDGKATEGKRITREVNGETRVEDVTIYPLVTDEAEGAVIRIDDVTERARIEQMLAQSEKMLSVGGLAAGMAHEINNPLAGIIQNMQVIRSRMQDDLPKNTQAAEACGITMEAMRAYMAQRSIPTMMESAMESGSRAARVVENMLDFAREREMAVSPHSLPDLLDQTVELASSDYDLKRKYDFRQIEIIREYEPDLPTVRCAGTKIQQVFLNVLKNGAEAMHEGDRKERPQFVLRATRDDGVLRVEIEDNGPGMDEATRKRVFEPFFTTKDVGAGTGLGLSVSYFIVTENHRGTMAAESSPEAGAKFVICLPLDSKSVT